MVGQRHEEAYKRAENIKNAWNRWEDPKNLELIYLKKVYLFFHV